VVQPVLLPIIGANDELLPAVEERLHPVALRAKDGERAARNGLYAAFEPKIHRFAQRLTIPRVHGTDVGVWDRDDVLQEAFIVFAELTEAWTPTIPFGRYLLANLPWRLRDAVYRGVGRRGVPPRTNAVDVKRALRLPDDSLSADDSASANESRALIVRIASRLPEPCDRIFYEHIHDGKSLTQIAADLGVSRRTVTRHWSQIRQYLAANLARPRPPEQDPDRPGEDPQ
jgi:RNA polymerase sigma factor (sigma-70 family)